MCPRPHRSDRRPHQFRSLARQVANTEPATPPAFSPGFADLMNTLVQPRHAKLGLSARDQNWSLTRYAADELKDSLANIARWRPQFRNQSVADMMEATTGEPIKAVEQAIETRNPAQFNAAYARLTELQFLSCSAQSRVYRDQGTGSVILRQPGVWARKVTTYRKASQTAALLWTQRGIPSLTAPTRARSTTRRRVSVCFKAIPISAMRSSSATVRV